ncbi:NUDIX domain-containing protein [Streptomyces rhizosphaericus]|uniref:NUDIX domain-containing protein n=1 Tax=Streptomyces rhizosphaericus TaxID=114699 RepID=UPI0035576D78
MWVLTPQLWEDLLGEHSFILESVTAIDSPQPDNAVSYRLYAARRPERVPSRPRSSSLPPPNAALGVGVIVRSSEGVLLGRHRRGTWELPGGSAEPGETFPEAAVRELHEEASLLADGPRRRAGTGHPPRPGGRGRPPDRARPHHHLVRHAAAARGGHRSLAVLAPKRVAPAAVRAQRPVPDRVEPGSPARPPVRSLPALPLPRTLTRLRRPRAVPSDRKAAPP